MSTVIDAYRSEKSSRVSTPDENSPFRRLKNPHPGMLPKADQREGREWSWQSSEAPFLS
jgi:hypothetical protein